MLNVRKPLQGELPERLEFAVPATKIPSRNRGMKISKSKFSMFNSNMVQPRQSVRIMGFLNFILLANSSTKIATSR